MPIEPHDAHPDRLLEVHEVAYKLRCSHETVLRRIRAKQLHAIRFGGHWRIDPLDLKAFIDANRTSNGNGNGHHESP
jgi:excisionase family DNA binding protein